MTRARRLVCRPLPLERDDVPLVALPLGAGGGAVLASLTAGAASGECCVGSSAGVEFFPLPRLLDELAGRGIQFLFVFALHKNHSFVTLKKNICPAL